MNGLQKIVAVMVVKQVKNIVVDYIIEQRGADKFKVQVYDFIDKLTDKTPYGWDDKMIDPMAKRILDSAELDAGVIDVLDGLINLLRQHISAGFLLDAGVDILVAVKGAFTDKMIDMSQLPDPTGASA